jgi:hypothetical protein
MRIPEPLLEPLFQPISQQAYRVWTDISELPFSRSSSQGIILSSLHQLLKALAGLAERSLRLALLTARLALFQSALHGRS